MSVNPAIRWILCFDIKTTDHLVVAGGDRHQKDQRTGPRYAQPDSLPNFKNQALRGSLQWRGLGEIAHTKLEALRDDSRGGWSNAGLGWAGRYIQLLQGCSFVSNEALTGPKKFFASVFKGSEYGNEILGKLTEIDKIAQDLKDEADILSKQTIIKINEGVANNHGKLDSLSTDITGRLDSMGNDMIGHIDSMGKDVVGQIDSMGNDLVNRSINVLNSVLGLLNSRLPPAELLNPTTSRCMQHPIKPIASRKSMFTRDAHKPSARVVASLRTWS